MATQAPSPHALTLQILAVVLFSFVGYLCAGIPLAVLPSYVNEKLGFSSAVAGLVIGLQYLATLVGRPLAGRMVDNHGVKKGMLYGLSGIGVSGLVTLSATMLVNTPSASLSVLLFARLLLGAALSIVGISALSWGISRVGVEHTARVISWNGIAAYSAIGIGAPLGVFMTAQLGIWTIGGSLMLTAALALLVLLPKPAIPVIAGERLSFLSVLRRVSPYGLGLALGSIGYGTLTTFITLYYGSRGWAGAAYCLTAFGAAFILARLLFIESINRLGGFVMAIACLGIEAVGLLILSWAPSPTIALMGAALAGLGLSIVYPALGIEVLGRIPPSCRSAGLGAYAIFFDLALGVAGPLMGVIAGHYGYPSIFLVSAALAGFGMMLAGFLALNQRQTSTGR